MNLSIKKLLLVSLTLSAVGLVFTNKAHAYSMTSVSDTITTSRPSVSAPLSANQAANATSATMNMLNNTNETYMASDSAKFLNSTGETLNIATIATTSAISSNLQTLFFGNQIPNTHHAGDAVIVPITAMHTITFTVNTALVSTDKIVLSFPSTTAVDTNTASPSASGFMFNGLSTGNIKTNGVTCSSIVLSGNTGGAATPTITCTVNASGVAANTAVTFLIGCSSATGTTCNTQVPTLINPTKSAAIGTSDSWSVLITDTDTTGATTKDTGKAIAGTVESVQVNAAVDEFLTVTIAGVADGASACSDTTNSGFGSVSTAVNLGTLTTGTTNKSAQTINVSTNAFSGYTITSTASGQLMNPATGYIIPNAQGLATANNTPVPVAINAGTAAYGIHPCGTDTATSPSWGTGGGTSNLFANPFSLSPLAFYYYTLASRSTAITAAAGNTTTVEYEATISTTTPAGNYQTAMTYVVTPTF